MQKKLNTRKTTGLRADYPGVQQVVELGLRKVDPVRPAETNVTPDANPLKGTADAFMRVLADQAPEAEDKDVDEFKRAIDDIRAQIGQSGHDQEIRRLAATGVKICEQFLKRSRHYYKLREAEFGEMIGILHDVAQRVGVESSDFNAQMRATTVRFHGLAQLEDIRELKKHLTLEATALHKTIEDKLQRDQQTLTVLTEKVQTLQAHLSEAEEQATIDPLTKVANRGGFDRALAKMANSFRSSKTPMSLVMVDIDHFKKINDTHGHPIGDRVLLCAAQWLTAAVRHTDVVARYGGEEFGVILADADLAAATKRFETVIAQIASRSFEYEAEGETRSIRFTVSCGVAQLTGGEAEADLIQRADQALYEAKRGGRNRVAAKKRSVLGSLFS